jgi:hypothetical protein
MSANNKNMNRDCQNLVKFPKGTVLQRIAVLDGEYAYDMDSHESILENDMLFEDRGETTRIETDENGNERSICYQMGQVPGSSDVFIAIAE